MFCLLPHLAATVLSAVKVKDVTRLRVFHTQLTRGGNLCPVDHTRLAAVRYFETSLPRGKNRTRCCPGDFGNTQLILDSAVTPTSLFPLRGSMFASSTELYNCRLTSCKTVDGTIWQLRVKGAPASNSYVDVGSLHFLSRRTDAGVRNSNVLQPVDSNVNRALIK